MDSTSKFNRVCTFCGESIAAEYKRCPYCGSLLGADKAHSESNMRDVNLDAGSSFSKNENSVYRDTSNSWGYTSNIPKETSNVWQNPKSFQKDTVKPWENAGNIPKETVNVREDTGNIASKAEPVQNRGTYGISGNEINKTAVNKGAYKSNTIAYNTKAAASTHVSPMGNGFKVFLVTVSNLLPGIGQLIGVIAGIVFMNAGEDKDRQSFGKAILISSVIVFLIMMILFGLLAIYFA